VLDDHDESVVTRGHLRRLLRGLPDLQILVTSRRPVDTQEGVTFPLPPLAVRTPELDGDPEAVELVSSVVPQRQRISRVLPNFAAGVGSRDDGGDYRMRHHGGRRYGGVYVRRRAAYSSGVGPGSRRVRHGRRRFGGHRR